MTTLYLGMIFFGVILATTGWFMIRDAERR
jgi:hypothetical protein